MALFSIWSTIGIIGAQAEKTNYGVDKLLPLATLTAAEYACFMYVPILIKKHGGEDWYKYTALMQLMGPCFTVLMTIFRPATNTPIFGFLSQLDFDLIFMAQGILN